MWCRGDLCTIGASRNPMQSSTAEAKNDMLSFTRPAHTDLHQAGRALVELTLY